MPAELPLIPSAVALAIGGLLIFLPARARRARGLGTAIVSLGAILPLALYPLVDPAHATGRALWEWSAVGGPTVRASYEVDPLAAVALALTVAFAGAALATAGRLPRRHPALAALVLGNGLVTIAVVVTDDLVAAIVALAVLAAITILALLAAAPPAATARAAGYLAVGLQAWVLAALLISRHGSAGFRLSEMALGTVSPSALAAAALGGLLFTGLYPVVAWSTREERAAADPGPIGSLVLMPAGIAVTLLLVRLLGASGLKATELPLPDPGPEARLGAIVLTLLAVAASVATSRSVPARTIVVGAAVIVFVAALPVLGLPYVLLPASLLTAAYAGVVSLALPDQWASVRADLALAAMWIGVATGAPLGVAGGAVALFACAASAIVDSLRVEPHHEYIALVGGSAVFVAGTVAVAEGVLTAADPAIAALGLAASATIILVELTQVARRSPPADVPLALTVSSAVAAVLLSIGASAVVVPLERTAGLVLPGPEALDGPRLASISVVAAFAVVLARVARPLLPRLEALAERSGPAMRALDPVPLGVGAFRAVEATAIRASAAFGLFEQRAGVWLATVLIVVLLVWAVR